jgi:hypothetical protein
MPGTPVPAFTVPPPGSLPLNITFQPPGAPTTAAQQESKPETMADILRQHGAVDDLPQLDRIVARRPSTGYLGSASLTKGTNNWSQFTLLELIAMQYGFLSSSPGGGRGNGYSLTTFLTAAFSQSSTFGFPDLARLRIRRPAPDRKSWQVQTIDLSPTVEAGDCSKDVPLEWGDVVEITEADHPLNEKWPGFSRTELANLKKCLTRQVQIVINGQATNVTLTPQIFYVGETKEPAIRAVMNPELDQARRRGEPYIEANTPFWLRPVLHESKLVLTSSDLSRVKVTRRDAASGQKLERVVDCSPTSPAPDFWLRDGDKVEVPEKTSASAAAQAPGPQSSPK